MNHDQQEATLRCRRASHCADAQTHKNTNPDATTNSARIPAWATTPNGLCRMDTTIVRRAIEQLPADYFELSVLLGKTSSGSTEYVAASRELPVPIRLNVEALSAAIVVELDLWAAPVAEASGFTYIETGRPEHRVKHASGWITGRWPVLLDLPPIDITRIDGRDETTSGRNPLVYSEEDGVTGALALHRLHEQVTNLAGRSHRAHRLNAPCPRCQRLTLERQEGAARVDCILCGHYMTLDAYEQLTNVLVGAHSPGVAA